MPAMFFLARVNKYRVGKDIMCDVPTILIYN